MTKQQKTDSLILLHILLNGQYDFHTMSPKVEHIT